MPPFPFYFVKPSTTVWDHNATVRIPKIAQDEQADYEGEMVSRPSSFSFSLSLSFKNIVQQRPPCSQDSPLPQCLVLGQDAKDIPVERALDYIAAYTVGNDISSRKLQTRPELAGPTPQFCFSKGFDTFAPLGPCLVASELIGDPSSLHLTTKINGQVRQDEDLTDLLFDCAYLIAYLSQGTTLQKGSVIMTGTPGGTSILRCFDTALFC